MLEDWKYSIYHQQYQNYFLRFNLFHHQPTRSTLLHRIAEYYRIRCSKMQKFYTGPSFLLSAIGHSPGSQASGWSGRGASTISLGDRKCRNWKYFPGGTRRGCVSQKRNRVDHETFHTNLFSMRIYAHDPLHQITLHVKRDIELDSDNLNSSPFVAVQSATHIHTNEDDNHTQNDVFSLLTSTVWTKCLAFEM